MKTTIGFAIAAMLSLGCGTSSAAKPPESPPPQASAAQAPGMHGGMTQQREKMAAMCPMGVEDTSVRAEPVEGGVAMVFTTTGDVAELRRRVAHMAQMHQRRQAAVGEEGMGHMQHRQSAQRDGEGMMREGMMGGGMLAGRMMDMPHEVRAEDIEGGARLVISPLDPQDLPELRAEVEEHAAQMESGRCPMMSTHDESGPPSPDGEP